MNIHISPGAPNFQGSHRSPTPACRDREQGVATVLALIALAVFSIIGLYMSYGTTLDLRITDNFESQLQASYAAQAGLSHARDGVAVAAAASAHADEADAELAVRTEHLAARNERRGGNGADSARLGRGVDEIAPCEIAGC